MFALLFVPSHPTPLCWSNSPSRHNLESILGQPTCDLRHNTLVKAQAACDKTPACGGVVKDAGVICEKHTTAGDHNARLDFELRTANPIPGAAQSWQRESCGNHSGAAIRQELGPSNARQGASTPQPDAASDPQRRASLRSGPPSAAFCVVGGLRSLVNSGVSSSLRRDVIEASGAEPADTFLMLNEVSSAADFRQARAALAPVLAVSSASSDCGSPLLKDLCSSVRESIGQASFAPGKSIIQLHWWKLCFDAVVAYEGIARASPYDWTIRLRPDVIALLPLPPLTSFVPNSVHYSRKNADIIFDVFYAGVDARVRARWLSPVYADMSFDVVCAVPANKRADFGEALVTLFKPYRSNQQLLSSCCPEEPLGSHLQRHFPMVEVLVPFALQV